MIDSKIQKLIEMGIFTDPNSIRAPRETERNRFGRMIYGHKTGAEIQILSPEQFANHRKYDPYGRYTGRGSGLHRVTKTTSCM